VAWDDAEALSRRRRLGLWFGAWAVALIATGLLQQLDYPSGFEIVGAAPLFPAGLFFFTRRGGGLLPAILVYGVLLGILLRTTEKGLCYIVLAVLCVLLAINVYGCQHVELGLGH
jgi:hypothetical protein